jgi:enterochelin esterase family protein
MKEQIFKILGIVLLLSLTGQGLEAQFGRGPSILSPEMNSDQTITFRLLSGGADSVSVSGNWMPGFGTMMDMARGDSGVWSVTIDVPPPEFYTYAFYVNGVKTLDPSNPLVVRDGSRYDNHFIVPGEGSDVYTVKDVPHGVVSAVWYPSPTLDKKRRMYVYTPPGYAESNEKYPVFYLLHGAGGDEEAWTDLGRTPEIMDNLIAEGKASPMIVVMTNGNAWSAAAPGHEPVSENAAPPDFSQMTRGAFEKSLVEDVIPFIEKQYRTLTDPDHRAIAGLSMGGMHTQTITNANPGKFAYIGVMSMGLMNNPRFGEYDEEGHKKQIQALQDSGLKLYWIGCGKDDFLYESVTTLRTFYDDLGFRYEYRESTGGHTWTNWRIYLSELAPRLFK